jgi:sterol desaturase/sphingolipid hydroxylase (fatty acid hydroxylase superfamily)
VPPELGWIALAVGLIVLEAILTRRLGRPTYEARETEVSLGLAFGWLLGGLLTTMLAMGVIAFGYAHRIAELGSGPLGLALCILLADFIYYWWHRLSHRWRWLWATHFVHHTAGRLNILASIRQGWTDALSGTWLSWAPLGFLGFPPQAVAVYFTVLLVWEAAIHNEWAGRLGPLEWVLATPSNHRVHHSMEARHLDRNFGGLLVIWDRLFGTYAPEGGRATRFGVAGFEAADHGPLSTAFHEWRRPF